MELQETKGEIYSISKDKKSISILGKWYHSFVPTNFNKGDNVFIKFVINKKDDKEFNNIKSITKIESPVKSNNETIKPTIELTATDKNCILMTAKDLAVEFKSISFNNWVNEVKRIREDI